MTVGSIVKCIDDSGLLQWIGYGLNPPKKNKNYTVRNFDTLDNIHIGIRVEEIHNGVHPFFPDREWCFKIERFVEEMSLEKQREIEEDLFTPTPINWNGTNNGHCFTNKLFR